MAERPDETGDDVQALAPLLVFALALPCAAQASDVKDRVRRDALDAAVVLANPHSAGVRIVLASVRPDAASPGVEAWTVIREDGKGDRVVVYTESSVFICASRHTPVHVNPYICLLKLASIIVHEAWHFRNGPDEAGAYEAQLQFLVARGAGSAAEIAVGVRRARDRVKARTKQAGDEARGVIASLPNDSSTQSGTSAASRFCAHTFAVSRMARLELLEPATLRLTD